MTGSSASHAICVLGMHRSGTSVTTRVVQLLGAYLGEEEDLLPAPSWNAGGLWERADVYLFHERILRALGTSWDTALPLPEDWHTSLEIAPFREELVALVAAKFADHRVWAWKDPRTALLLPLWRDALAELGVPLTCLLVTRNPLDVARSIESRDGTPASEALGVWLNYNLAMWANSSGLPRALLSYDRLVDDWEGSLRSWSRILPFSIPAPDHPVREQIDRAIRKDLRHSASTVEDVTRAGCATPVCEMALLLHQVRQPGDFEDASVNARAAALLEAHLSLSTLYRHDATRAHASLQEAASQRCADDARTKDELEALHLLATEKEGRIEELSQQVRELQQQRERDQELSASQDREMADLRQSLEMKRREITALEQNIAEQSDGSARLHAENDELRQTLDIQKTQLEHVRIATSSVAASLRGVLESRSWQVTRPLRAAADVLEGLRQGPEALREAAHRRRIREQRQHRWTSKRRPTVSICILAQNNRRSIEACLNSVARVADEILVVDSGSDDGTLDVVRRYAKARVIQHPFTDIAAQRNVYLAEAAHDWILSIDADEVMGESLRESLPGLLTSETFSAYWFPRYWLVSVEPLQYVQNEVTYPDYQLRLLANLPGLYYYNRVHQQIEVPGDHLSVDKPHLFHLHYLLNDRAQREARLQQYEQLQAKAGTGVYCKYYAFEDDPFEVHACRENLGVDAPTLEQIRQLVYRTDTADHDVPAESTLLTETG